jgi:hypothetical protein
MTIDMLPDVALLRVFDCYMEEAPSGLERWHILVHVCRKWRGVVFGSPRRLNLRLFCEARTPVRETLDVWPLLPIIISVHRPQIWDADNIVAALERNDRICNLTFLDISRSQSEKVLGEMQQPFPALTSVWLRFKSSPVIPASFLGGSAPSLRTFALERIPFPGLPKLLLSATHLVDLDLRDIPHSGYFSPETIVTCVSTLTALKGLRVEFESPRSCPDRRSRHPPPRTRNLLPVLTKLWFKGVSEYLEDLVARINAPLLDNLLITIYNQLILDTPQLTQLINRSSRFKAREARVVFNDREVWVSLPQTGNGALSMVISCRQSDWQLSSLAQICSSSFPQTLIPAVEHLYIHRGAWPPDWQDDLEISQWLELLHPFTAVKDLYISEGFIPRIAPALKELVGERVSEVLPALQTLFLPETLLEPVQEAIGQFIAARQITGQPITTSHWDGR